MNDNDGDDVDQNNFKRNKNSYKFKKKNITQNYKLKKEELLSPSLFSLNMLSKLRLDGLDIYLMLFHADHGTPLLGVK